MTSADRKTWASDPTPLKAETMLRAAPTRPLLRPRPMPAAKAISVERGASGRRGGDLGGAQRERARQALAPALGGEFSRGGRAHEQIRPAGFLKAAQQHLVLVARRGE